MKTNYLYILVITAVFNCLTSFAQDFSEGFKLLENGDFAAAETYFAEKRQLYPDNKTVAICYARALGLSSDPEGALNLFKDLENQYQGDYEIGLNLAEAYLWNKQFDQALKDYKVLTAKDAESFPAQLGLANTYSNLKQYPLALETIEKALAIDPGNPGAMNSKFYIILGYADQEKKAKNFEKADALFQALIKQAPENSLARIVYGMFFFEQKQWDAAEDQFQLIPDAVERYRHLALLEQAKENSKEALVLAKVAVDSSQTQDAAAQLKAKERLVQAYLWNAKFNEAKAAIDQLQLEDSKQTTYLALLANYYNYTDQPQNSLDTYNKILDIDSSSYDGLMGKAGALRALNQKKLSVAQLDSVLKYYPGQADAIQLQETIANSLKTNVKTEFAYQEDNDTNVTYLAGLTLTLPLNDRHGLTLNYNNRNTTRELSDSEATSNTISLGYTTRIHNRTTATISGGFTKVTAGPQAYTQWNAQAEVKTVLLPRNNFSLAYQRSIQDFNATLLASELVLNNFILNNNLMLIGNLGWYTQARYVALSDDNQSQQVFTSLYYSLGKKSIFKFGANYQFLTFKEDRAELYFSPDSFNNVEGFARFDHNGKRFVAAIEVAVGTQTIDDQDAMNTLRGFAEFKYNYNKRLVLGVFGRYSNSASDAANGFSFYQVGISGQIRL
ncbi:tetratricopeptide repeat protein [Gilvibacter sp.]|uniref:tetratricopeptide repeat protein n=1 Tax=Gilvibacter sp. TaxID=2729997 RepID=UPI003F4A3DC9